MGKYKNVTDFTEILHYCVRELKLDWNTMCDVLDNYRPYMEVSIYEYHIDEFKEGGEYQIDDPEGAKIMLSFMEDMGYKNMSVIDE